MTDIDCLRRSIPPQSLRWPNPDLAAELQQQVCTSSRTIASAGFVHPSLTRKFAVPSVISSGVDRQCDGQLIQVSVRPHPA
jgi:hypothetical protein